MSTYYLSLLCPAFATKCKKYPDLVEMCNSNIGMDWGDNVEFFKLVKIEPGSKIEGTDFTEVAVRLKNSDFSMKTIESIIQQKEKMQEQIERLTSYWNVLGENTDLSGDATFDTNAINQLRGEIDVTKAKMHKLEEDNK